MASHSKSPPRSGGKRGSRETELSTRQRALYALPLDEFTRSRDALAKEFASKGRAQDAQATKKLKRPVVAAWVINQLAHQHVDHLEDLLSAASALKETQRRAMSGLASEPLKEANRAFQLALDALMKGVNASLATMERPAAGDLIRQIDETLRTASLGSEEDRSTLTQGMLTRPLHSSGLGPFSGLELVEQPAPSAPSQGGKVLQGPWKPRERADEEPSHKPPPPARKAPAPTPRPPLRPSHKESKAQARHEREVELRQLRREARQQEELAERTKRSARQNVVRTHAVLRTAEAKTRHARDVLEAAEATAQKAREALEVAEEQARSARQALEAAQEAEQAQAEEAAQAEKEAQAAEQALTQARRHLEQAESRLSR